MTPPVGRNGKIPRKSALGPSIPPSRSGPRPGLAGPKAEKTVCLALQGGGAHGAFTWGVLDAILEDGRLGIEAISGTSAGAMNGVVLAEGFMEGGIAGARRQLTDFWQAVAVDGVYSPLQRDLMNRLMGAWNLDPSPGLWWLDLWTRHFSPYDTNPLNINPLRGVLENLINFDKVRTCRDLFLYVAATNVRTGKIAIFPGDQLTADHVMASACLPMLFQAVEIDGEAYWDGGYMGNPALYPLFYEPRAADVILVQVNPLVRNEVPTTARDIQSRLTEITFNATLLRELRAIHFVTELIDRGVLPKDGPYKRVNMHRIDGGPELSQITASSRLSTERDFLQHLHSIGRAAGHRWLAEHYADIGKRSTLDLAAEIA